jgi:hypothetical protein
LTGSFILIEDRKIPNNAGTEDHKICRLVTKLHILVSIADPHHVYADPNPSFQIKAQNLVKALKSAHIYSNLACHLQIDVDPDPDPAYHFDADTDPDPVYHFGADTDPDPAYHFDVDADPGPAF